jgi:hypothetical protein
LTALELVQREALLGGMDRVREVLRELCASCTHQGLIDALEAMQEVPTAQRLGVLFALEDQAALASRVAEWLRNKPLRLVSLEHGQTPDTSSAIDAAFKVRLPPDERNANT